MKSVHWLMAGAFVVALGCTGPAFANDGKEHHDGGKWRHSQMGCSKMSKADRDLLHSAMEKAHKQNEALLKDMHAKHEALHKILSAKNFDEKAFLSATDDLADLHAKMQHNMAEAFAGVAGKLSPEERTKCAMFMAGGMHPHGMMGHHGWGHGGGPGEHHHHGMHGGPGMEHHDGGGMQPSTDAPKVNE